MAKNMKTSTDKVLLIIRCNFGGVLVNEQNLIDAYVKHKGNCHNTGKWKCSLNLAFTKIETIRTPYTASC